MVSAVMVLLMVVLGGVTRLTGAGLSIVEWKPVVGIIPPISDSAWEIEFDKYKQSPEFIKINSHMGLSDFKKIFLIEFVHRFVGRVVGLFFFVPLLFMIVMRAVPPKSRFLLIIVSAMGLCQAVMGWYMVKSGLVKDPHVSHFRLSLHLLFAAIIFGLLIWEAFAPDVMKLHIFEKKPSSARGESVLKMRYNANLSVTRDDRLCVMSLYLLQIFVIICYVQISFGALVAGLKAGFVYNQFPMMGNYFAPEELWGVESFVDAISDPVVVQFVHRIVAYALCILACVIFAILRRSDVFGASMLLGAMLIQFSFGVFTLLYSVPLVLGVLHQLMAFILLGIALSVLRCNMNINRVFTGDVNRYDTALEYVM